MKKFKYYYNGDSLKEALDIISAHDWENAVKLAADRKNLEMDTFLQLFSVIEVNDNEKSF